MFQKITEEDLHKQLEHNVRRWLFKGDGSKYYNDVVRILKDLEEVKKKGYL